MKIKELMLNNWVLAGTKTQFPMQVIGVFKDVVYLDFEGNEGDMWEEKENDILPMPLTEELLVKNGFVLDDGGYVNEYSYKDERGSFVHVSYLDGKCIHVRASVLKQKTVIEGYHIEYLHQLQNLLTFAGIEIQFKV